MGSPLSPAGALGPESGEAPSPQPLVQAALSLRSRTGQHSCGRGSLPAACLNLAPASDDPAPPPPSFAGLGEPAGEALRGDLP